MQKGFTLIEILISISVSILLFFVLAQVHDISHRTYRSADSKAEIIQNGRVILDRLVREIRQSPEIITEISQDTSEASNEIIFQDGHEISNINYIRYYVDQNQLFREEFYFYFSDDASSTHVYFYAKDDSGNDPIISSSTPKIIGEYIDEIEFWGNKLININLYLSKGKFIQTINTSAYGRNL